MRQHIISCIHSTCRLESKAYWNDHLPPRLRKSSNNHKDIVVLERDNLYQIFDADKYSAKTWIAMSQEKEEKDVVCFDEDDPTDKNKPTWMKDNADADKLYTFNEWLLSLERYMNNPQEEEDVKNYVTKAIQVRVRLLRVRQETHPPKDMRGPVYESMETSKNPRTKSWKPYAPPGKVMIIGTSCTQDHDTTHTMRPSSPASSVSSRSSSSSSSSSSGSSSSGNPSRTGAATIPSPGRRPILPIYRGGRGRGGGRGGASGSTARAANVATRRKGTDGAADDFYVLHDVI